MEGGTILMIFHFFRPWYGGRGDVILRQLAQLYTKELHIQASIFITRARMMNLKLKLENGVI